MIAFAMPGYEKKLPTTATVGHYSLHQYPSGEQWVWLDSEVAGHDCLVVGTISPPEHTFVQLTQLADTLRRSGAKTITAYLPYLAYSRQDKPAQGQSNGFLWAMRQLHAAGVTKLLTIDLHNLAAADSSPLPIVSIAPAKLFAKYIEVLPDDCRVVAPDKGAALRSRDLARMLGMPDPLVLSKTRTSAGVDHQQVGGVLPQSILIVDDILDTGETLRSCCRRLKERGATTFTLVITHGVFSRHNWRQLRRLGIAKLYVSDSLPLPRAVRADSRVVVCTLPGVGHAEL